jgi:hypothetical protein
LIVVGTVQTASAIALEATLSFLGVGLPPTEPSLGLLISNGFNYMLSGRYWIAFFPGIALLLTIVAINLVVVANAALCRTARGVVMHAPAVQQVATAVISSERDRNLDDATGSNDRVDQPLFKFEPGARFAHAEFRGLEGGVVLLCRR